MDHKLKTILSKLIEAKTTALNEEELRYLQSAVGESGEEAAPTGPRPLWAFIKKQMFLHQNIYHFYFDYDLDPILTDCGVGPEYMKQNAFELRKLAPVTEEALKRSVRRHLGHEMTGPRAHATRLVGLAELHELAPLVVDSLQSGREERQDWGMPVISASLDTLTLLRHPQARAFGLRYVTHRDHGVKRSAQHAVLIGDGTPPAPEELERLMEAKLEPQTVDHFIDAFIAAGLGKKFTPDDLEELLTNAYLGVTGADNVARMILTLHEAGIPGWREVFQKYLGHDNSNVRAAMAVRAGWSNASWTAPLMMARLGDEEDDEVKTCLVAAIGSFGKEYRDFVKERLKSDEPCERVGAAWATLGTSDLNAELEPLLVDAEYDVRRAASCALAVNQKEPSRDLIELKWTELLNIDHWWPWALPLRALMAIDCPLPRSTRSFLWISNDQVQWVDAALEEAKKFYREHPHQLLRWLIKETPDSQRARAASLCGLVGGPVMRSALEQSLLASEYSHRAAELALELACAGGPKSRAAELKSAVALDETYRAKPEDLAICAAFAMVGDTELRKRFGRALGGVGEAAEPFLVTLLASGDADVAQAAADAATQIHGAKDPLLADVAALLNSEARRLSSLATAERLVSCRAPRVRATFAEVAAHPENPPQEVLRWLLELAVDKDENVAAAALGSLAVVAQGAEWAKQLVLQQTWSEQWRTKEKAVSAMAQIADPMFLPRLLELVEQDDYTIKEHSVTALERIAQQHPERGLIVLDIREPHRVRDRYGLNDQINYEADQHSEALRMLLLGLEKRREAAEATKHRGRKVMLMPARSEQAHGAAWSQKQFEALAMYLKVTYTDEDSGAIIAEIGEEPSGEVLSALLQSNAVAATTIGWS